MPVTIKSIAAEAGISYQAVSAVLNGKTNCRVSPERREKILAIARERGYRTNFGYKLMQKQKTCTVGIISAMRQIESEEYVHHLVLHLMNRFNHLGYATYFNNLMTPDAELNLRQIRDLITRGVEHFIFLGTPCGHEVIEHELERQELTYIGFKSHFRRDLSMDSAGASETIVRFLRQQAGEAIALVLPGPRPETSARFEALCRVFPDKNAGELLRRHVIMLPELQWAEPDFNARIFELGYEGTAQAFARPEKPRALFFLSDNYALGGAAYCYRHGIAVGRDVHLAGYNDIEAVRFHAMPISSAAHPFETIIEILIRESRNRTPFREILAPVVKLRTFTP